MTLLSAQFLALRSAVALGALAEAGVPRKGTSLRTQCQSLKSRRLSTDTVLKVSGARGCQDPATRKTDHERLSEDARTEGSIDCA